MTTAATAVLVPCPHADELLVRVLACLSISDVTRARAVCSVWRRGSDSNYIWRRLCGQRWPSALTDPVRRVILASGGYRAYYLATALRSRSVLADFVFTFDVTATSYVGLPYTEAIGGASFSGGDLVPAADDLDDPESRRFISTMRKPLRFTSVPYVFKTLGDLVEPVPIDEEAEEEQPQQQQQLPVHHASKPCHPELKLQVGVVHRSELKHAQLATLSDGRDFRTLVWYRDHGSARFAGQDSEAPRSPRRKGPKGRRCEPTELTFSGSVVLPTHLGGVDRQVLDVSLRGTVTELADATRVYDITTAVVGPLFNLSEGPAAATAADMAECFDLKLGLHTEDKGIASQPLF
jgi:hypothetical protein